jgi:hypothetical protein
MGQCLTPATVTGDRGNAGQSVMIGGFDTTLSPNDGHGDSLPVVDDTPGNAAVPVVPVADAVCAWLFAHDGDDMLGSQDGEADITARQKSGKGAIRGKE